MALFGAVQKAASQTGPGISNQIGGSLQLISSFFQNHLSIRDIEGRDDAIVFNTVDSEALNMVVQVSEKPVADAGAAVDYVSRISSAYTLTGIISNRTVDLAEDPAEFVTQHIASLVPDVAGVVNTVASAAGKFFDLGLDEIDRKFRTLRKWQLNATIVDILGDPRLDLKNFTPIDETISYLITSLSPVNDLSTGDTVGFTISLQEFLNLQESKGGIALGGKLTNTITGALNLPNPFPF